jgi:hypothetical protein
MPLQSRYIDDEQRLDVIVQGNLDISLSQEICDICRRAAPGLRACIVDLSDAGRIFDSGVALLQMLHRKLSALGATTVILSDDRELSERLPSIVQASKYPRSALTH